MMHMQLSGPLFNGQSLPLKFKVDIAPCIVKLFLQGSPSTVGRPPFFLALIAMAARIVTIGIHSVYAVVMTMTRLWPHVSKKVFKAVEPTSTNFNTASTPVFVASAIGFRAAISHLVPAIQFWRASHAMLCICFDSTFSRQTPTAFAAPASEGCLDNNAMFPTFTIAQPERLAMPVVANKAKYSKATIDIAGQVFDLLVGYGDNLRQFVRGYMFRVHQNLQFWCQAQGHSQCRLGIFACLLPLHYNSDELEVQSP